MQLNDKLKLLVEDLKKYNPEKVILFGSYAREESDKYSDLDIVVIKETGKPFLKRLKEITKYCTLNEAIDFFVYTKKEIEEMKKQQNPFIERVLKEGRVIYEKL